MKHRSPETTLGGIDLLEQSVHALRGASAATLLCYYLGTVPFVLAALFFWADMSQSGLAEEHLVPGAVGLALLFVWMKFWQSAFAHRLSAQVANEVLPRMTAAASVRAIASQALLQSTGLILIPIAAQIVLPLGWIYAFYQNATVFGLREPSFGRLARRSWKQAMAAPRQNHAALLVLGLFGLFVFLNVAIVLFTAPRLLKMLFGVESNFTLGVESSLNTTFLAATLGVTYLCFDPLVKAVYVLRCFYSEARTTGEDLRVMLRFLSKSIASIVVIAFLLASSIVAGAQSSPAPTPPKTAPATELDRSIDEVLKRREYTWRSPRPKKEKSPREESEISKQFREWLKEAVQSFFEWIGRVVQKIFRPPGAGGGQFSWNAQGLTYIAIALGLIIVGVLVWMLWRSRSRSHLVGMEATPAAPLPDLASEDVTGEELPVDGWMQLALELLERGELRLAMRAFYFSSLAHLAERNLVSIAKFKSNRDYERELRRRSHALPEVSHTFSENVSVFDRVWYGMHEINADLLQHFRSNVERIRAC